MFKLDQPDLGSELTTSRFILGYALNSFVFVDYLLNSVAECPALLCQTLNA